MLTDRWTFVPPPNVFFVITVKCFSMIRIHFVLLIHIYDGYFVNHAELYSGF
jgi:hypothetical protein